MSGGWRAGPGAVFQMLGGDVLVVLVRTLAVGLAIGCLATFIAIPWGWVIGASRGKWGAFVLVPLCLPSYLVYIGWSLLRAPGTYLGDALVGAPDSLWQFANTAQASIGLALWAWPIAAIILSVGVDRKSVV